MSNRILVVEDNPMNMELVIAILEGGGYEVAGAIDAEEGIELAKASNFDLVLMDVSLPGMSGLEATQALKNDPRTSHLPVIALTAHAMESDRSQAMAAGCDGYLTKPINRTDLLEVVRLSVEAA